MAVKLTTQQKGRCGELFVQYMLLKYGIESARLTTDPGIDLLAYPLVPSDTHPFYRPYTIQVKTSSHHRGKKNDDTWLEWTLLNTKFPTDLVCLVDLERSKLWFFRLEEFRAKATNKNQRIWWAPPGHEYKRAKQHEEDFSSYEGEKGILRILDAT